MDKKVDVLDFLKLLMHVFDDMGKYMDQMKAVSKKYEKEFEQLKDVELSDLGGFDMLMEKFSSKEIPILMKIFANLMEYESKYKLIFKEREREAIELDHLIKNTSTSLHNILDGKK